VQTGGNDYNHGGSSPSNATFSQGYESFLLQVFATCSGSQKPAITPKVVSICGQGSPLEQGTQNNRCKPCPHVEDAVNDFKAKHPDLAPFVYFILVPCDGSVVTGVDDIGCAGHKNKEGQSEVADFLLPKLQDIMQW